MYKVKVRIVNQGVSAEQALALGTSIIILLFLIVLI